MGAVNVPPLCGSFDATGLKYALPALSSESILVNPMVQIRSAHITDSDKVEWLAYL